MNIVIIIIIIIVIIIRQAVQEYSIIDESIQYSMRLRLMPNYDSCLRQ